MNILNPKHVEQVLELINSSPYFRLLDMRVSEMCVGRAVVEMAMSPKLRNCFGGIHGGVYASVIDTAAYWAVYGDVDEDSGFTSIDVSVSDLSSLQEGTIIVKGTSVKAGRSLCLAEASVFAGDGRLLAHGTSKMMILKGRQSVRQLAASAGIRLPPKFLPENAG